MSRSGGTPPTSVRLRHRARYHFDNLLSRGTGAVLAFLAAVTLAVLIASAVLLSLASVSFTDTEGASWFEGFWQSMLRAIDPGTMGSDAGWGPRLVALLVTLFGILVAGTLIGIIASGVEQRVAEMQRGRSVVVESNHALILGASARLPVIVNQLTLARRTRRGNAIVVLADRDPRETNDDVRATVQDPRGTRLVFRRGDPTRRADLAIVAVDAARLIIVLADDEAENDAAVVNAVLAVGAELGGFDRTTVLAEVGDEDTAENLVRACGGRVHSIAPMQGIGRVMASTLCTPGLNQVVEELIDYRGCDIYVRDVGSLCGTPFGEIVNRFSKARPIGLIGPDGALSLNPDSRTTLTSDHRLAVIADDAEALETNSYADRQPGLEPPSSLVATPRRKEEFLIIGWSSLGRELFAQLARIAAPGSSARLVYDARLFEPDELGIPSTDRLPVTVTPIRADTWQPDDEQELEQVTSIVLLGYRRGLSVEEADSRTLLNLMLLKPLTEGFARPRIVAELRNADRVDLAQISGADDLVVSDAMASRFIAQLAEQTERRPVLIGLLSADGPGIRMIEAEELGLTGDPAWHDVIDTVYATGSIAIGWRRASARGGEVTLNPGVSERVLLEAGDQIAVVG